MTPQDEATKIEGYLTATWAALEARGATIPAEKNTTNLGVAVRSIPAGGGYDPSNPTLEGLQKALNAGDYDAFGAGTKIPDVYNGVSSPLVVAQYLDSSNNSDYGGAEGVLLTRENIDNANQPFGSSATNVSYPSSAVFSFLGGDYLNGCSDELKSYISEFSVPWYSGSATQMVSSKVHLFSGVEIGGTYNSGEGQMLSLWQQKTGLSSPNNSANDGRKMSASGVACSWLTRSRLSATTIVVVSTSGYVGSQAPNLTAGILPMFFIAKGQSNNLLANTTRKEA